MRIHFHFHLCLMVGVPRLLCLLHLIVKRDQLGVDKPVREARNTGPGAVPTCLYFGCSSPMLRTSEQLVCGSVQYISQMASFPCGRVVGRFWIGILGSRSPPPPSGWLRVQGNAHHPGMSSCGSLFSVGRRGRALLVEALERAAAEALNSSFFQGLVLRFLMFD